MLKLFGGRPDHPLADPKEAKRILDALPAPDVKALEELSQWVESVSTAEGFKPADRVQLLTGLDEAALVRVRKLGRDYFAATRPSRYLENLMWTQLHEYWRQAGQAWSRALDEALQGKGDAKALPVLASRALRALGQQLKWQHMRYGPIDNAVWGLLNKAYLGAEARGAAATKVSLYSSLEAATSPQLEFLRAAMFSASAPDGLLPAEIELAERLIAELSAGFDLSKLAARELLFWSDLQKPMPPQRAVKAIPESASVRCFGPGVSLATLEEHIGKVLQLRAVPSGLNLGGVTDHEMLLEVMRHLQMHWAYDPPERKHARHPVKSRLAIANGFKGALDALGGSAGLDFEKKGSESWIVENVSAGGFGAVVPQVKGDWLKVGVMLALQPDGGTNWVAGIVRRVNKVSSQEARVGIETVSRAPAVVEFKLGALGAHKGLLLPAAVLGSNEVSIALPPNVYGRGMNLEAQINGRHHVYMPVSTPERGEDYEMLRFREMVKEA